MHRWVRRSRAARMCSAGLALAAVCRAGAQQAAPRATGPLDTRSVLMAWTNQLAPIRKSEPAETNEVAAPVVETDQRIRQANEYSHVGSTDRALILFKDILSTDPKNKEARFGLGTTYIQMEQYSNALAVLEPMMAEFPQDYALRNNIAWLYATAKDQRVRDGQKAIRIAQDALLIAPNDFHVWSTLSESYYVAGQYNKALRSAEEALRLCQETATGESPAEYLKQVDKCRKAVQAMSVVE